MHNFGLDIERAVGQCIAVGAAAGVVVKGVEQQNVSRGGGIVPAADRKRTAAVFDKAYDVIFVEMRRKGLRDTLEKAGFKRKLLVAENFTEFFFQNKRSFPIF